MEDWVLDEYEKCFPVSFVVGERFGGLADESVGIAETAAVVAGRRSNRVALERLPGASGSVRGRFIRQGLVLTLDCRRVIYARKPQKLAYDICEVEIFENPIMR